MASKITSCIKSGYYSDNYVPYTDYRYYQNVMKFQYIVLQLELQWEQLMAQAEIQGEETRPTHPPPLLHHPGKLKAVTCYSKLIDYYDTR